MKPVGVMAAFFVLFFGSLAGSVWSDQGRQLAMTNKMAEAVIRPTGYPKWFVRIPDGCFVGISNHCQSIEAARQQALHSALSQILQAMGADYELNHESLLSGNLHHSHHELKELLSYSCQWFLRSVQQNILKSHIQDSPRGYTCYLLIHFPEDKIKELRRLSIGPKLGARIRKSGKEGIFIEVRENNGVVANVTGYQLKITTENRHAEMITLFAWKVPKKAYVEIDGVLDRKVIVKGNTEEFLIPMPATGATLKKLILGSETRIAINLMGYDEIGRELTLPVSAF